MEYTKTSQIALCMVTDLIPYHQLKSSRQSCLICSFRGIFRSNRATSVYCSDCTSIDCSKFSVFFSRLKNLLFLYPVFVIVVMVLTLKSVNAFTLANYAKFKPKMVKPFGASMPARSVH